MQDNSTNDVIELLVRFADGELSGTEKANAEKSLQQDAAVNARYENLLAAKEAIKSRGLKLHVQSLQQQYLAEVREAGTPGAKVIRPSFVKTVMRIAAVFILVVAGYGAYMFSFTNNESVYEDNFIHYQLPITRGDGQPGDIDALYNANNYTAVITAVNAKPQKTQKDHFLAAQANLNINNTAAAIDAFRNIEALNNTAGEKYFVQETDYYLALAFIKAGNISEAEKQLQKITSNKNHLFYSKAKEVSGAKLLLLKWKE